MGEIVKLVKASVLSDGGGNFRPLRISVTRGWLLTFKLCPRLAFYLRREYADICILSTNKPGSTSKSYRSEHLGNTADNDDVWAIQVRLRLA